MISTHPKRGYPFTFLTSLPFAISKLFLTFAFTKPTLTMQTLTPSEYNFFTNYAMSIGIPISKWWQDQWVQAYSLMYGVGVEVARKEIEARNREVRCCCCGR